MGGDNDTMKVRLMRTGGSVYTVSEADLFAQKGRI